MKLVMWAWGLAALCGMNAGAQVPAKEAVYNTRSKQWLTVAEAAAQLEADTVLVLGEQHVTVDNQNDRETILHHANQARWLKAVQREASVRNFAFQLGMEFLEYPSQNFVDQFLAGSISQADFLQAVHWAGNPFAPYGRVMWESVAPHGGGTLALNIPKDISRQVAAGGPATLSPAQRALLPPIWEEGSAAYFARFKRAMGGHMPQEKLKNYFWAQSLWDDTMAWRAAASQPVQLTIVVGEFHVEFGHGLPARLNRYGERDVRTMIQVGVDANTSFDEAVQPDPEFGPRADYVWVFTRG